MGICAQIQEPGTHVAIVSEIVAKDSSSDGGGHVCDTCLERQKLSASCCFFFDGKVRCLWTIQLEMSLQLHVCLQTLC